MTIYVMIVLLVSMRSVLSVDAQRETEVQARIAIELCRRAGHTGFRLSNCYFFLHKEHLKHGFNVDEFVGVWKSEEAMRDAHSDNVEIKLRRDIRTCFDISRGFHTSVEDAEQILTCMRLKNYTWEVIKQNRNIWESEDLRRRCLNRMAFEWKTKRLIDELRRNSFINDYQL